MRISLIHCCLAGSALLLPAIASAGIWDWLRLEPRQLEAFVRLDGRDRRNDPGGETRDLELETGVRLTQRGSVLDPGIARFRLQIEPVLRREDASGTATAEDRDGEFLSYLADVELFQGTPGPFSGNLGAARTTDTNVGSLGSRSENEVETLHAALNWDFAPLPLRFAYRETSLRQLFRSGISSGFSERDETLETFSVRGANRKMRVLAEHQSLDDRISSRNQDYAVDRLDWWHNLSWGSGSQLTSRFDYYERTGISAFRRTGLFESATIRHTDRVRSSTNYTYSRISQTFTTDEHRGEIRVQHNLYGNLLTSGKLWGLTRRSEVADEDRALAGIDSFYQKSDLWGGRVRLGAGVTYGPTRRVSRGGLIEVIDESQLVPLAGTVTLERRFVLAATVVVTDATGLLVFEEGLDYEILTPGDDLTQVFALPGGRIETGDRILVNYRAESLPSLDYTTLQTRYELGFDLGWFRFSHRDNRSDENPRSGVGESFLFDRRFTFTNVEFRWDVRRFSTLFAAERSVVENGDLRTKTYTLRQKLEWAPGPQLRMDLSLLESLIRTDGLETELYSLEWVTEWRPVPSLSLRPRIGAWQRQDSGQEARTAGRQDRFIHAGIALRWVYGKVFMDLLYDRNRRTTDQRQTDEDRVFLNLRRRF